jgi:hypothetical protein
MCVNCGVSSCSSCNTNSYIPDSTSALKYDGPKFVCPTDFTVLPGASLNDMMNTLMEQICTNASSVDSVTGLDTDNTDPENPIVQIAVDGVTITGEGTPASPLVSSGGGGGFTHYLGEEFEGGVIYYLYKDSGGVEHGLIVNKAEQALTIWQNTGTLTGADRTEDGAYNTSLMTDSPAEVYVTGLTDGGFTDWYLPSIDELNLLWDNRYSANKALRAIVGADLLSNTDNYWSSTESTDAKAYFFNFFNGNTFTNFKTTTSYSGRAIRSF